MTEAPISCLVVDDEPQLRDALRRVLELSGYEVFVAASGLEAIQVLEATQIPLVISDIRPKVGFNHRLIIDYCFRHALGQFLAMTENKHPATQVNNRTEIVFNQNECLALLPIQVANPFFYRLN